MLQWRYVAIALKGYLAYCHVPARWGLQQTHPGLRAAKRHGVRDPLVRSLTLSLEGYSKQESKQKTQYWLIPFKYSRGTYDNNSCGVKDTTHFLRVHKCILTIFHSIPISTGTSLTVTALFEAVYLVLRSKGQVDSL